MASRHRHSDEQKGAVHPGIGIGIGIGFDIGIGVGTLGNFIERKLNINSPPEYF